MTALEELKVILGAEISDYEKKMDRATQVHIKFGKNLQDFGISMTRWVTAPMLLAAGTAVKFAADVVESENLFTVSMGKMADAGRSWSTEFSQGLGLNEYEIRQNLGMLNQMLSSMGLGEQNAYKMARGLTALSQDMASFFNLNPADAMMKLQSGITGEVEPLRHLGILVDENTVKMVAYKNGIATVGSELTQVQKVQARYIAIMEQTAAAHGDLARTIDSPVNMMRILASNTKLLTIAIGNELLPVFTTLLRGALDLSKVGLDLVKAFSGLPAPVKNTTVVLAGLVAALGPVFVATGWIISKWPIVTTLFTKGAAAIGPLVQGFALLAAKVLLLAGVFVFFYANGLKIADGLSGVFLAFVGSVLGALARMAEGLAKIASYLPSWGNALKARLASDAQDIRIWANAADAGAQDFADSFSKSGGWIDNTKAKLQEWKDAVLGTFQATADAAAGAPPPVPPPPDFTLHMSRWEKFRAYITATSKDLADKVTSAFTQLGVGIVSSLAQGTFDGQKLLLDFAVKTLEMVVEWAIAGALAASGLSQALAVAMANPWIAAGVILGLIGVVAGLSAAYKAKVGGTAMATGGMTTGQISNVTLGDNPSGKEVVMPLDSPRTTSALAKAMPAGGTGEQTIILMLGDEEVARSAVRGMPSVIHLGGIGHGS